MSSRSFAPAGATFFWQQRQKKAKTPTGEGGNPRKEDAAALSGKAAKGCAVRMPPLLHLSPPTKEGPSGPLWIPSWSERSPIRASRHTMPRSGGRAARSEWTRRLCGESQQGAEAHFWSLRRVGGSKGEGDPFERVPFPLGVLWPSFPTREKKVGPQAETPALVAPADAKLC